MNSKTAFTAAAFLLLATLEAQQSKYFSNTEDYRLTIASDLYRQKIYSAAQYEYARQYFYNGSLSNSGREAALFFDRTISVILQKSYAEKGLEAFMQQYPHSAMFAEAAGPLADYYLVKKDFQKALETLETVNQYQLSKSENARHVMKIGYAKFMTGDTAGATEALEEAYTNAGAAEKNDIAYMLGHLYYTGGQSAKAFGYFDLLRAEPKYSSVVKPYYVQLYFNQKNYGRAVSEGNELLNENISENYRSEVHKIIGESYFMQDDFQAAYPHLKIYLESKAEPSQNDLYEMGFVASQLKKYDESVSWYSKLINTNSPMAQNAYYQLGNSYLQVGKKQEALSAFRSAYQMDYDKKVKQLAHLQYAKLGYDIGNPFESPSPVIQNYLVKYPDSPSKQELKTMLLKSYLYSGDYAGTLNALNAMPTRNTETEQIDQEVSYLLGIEEFNKGNFGEAEKYFNRSKKFRHNAEFYSEARYWLAQTYYRQGRFAESAAAYEELKGESFKEKQQLNYDLAYAYFKNKDFDKAKKYFAEYLKNPQNEFKTDAELRLADAYYAGNQLDEAFSIYNRVGGDDYTLFQKALIFGFKGDTEAKIRELKTLLTQYKSSEYADNAMFEIATAYAANDDFAKSNTYLEQVIKNSADSDLVANAEIYRAQNFIDQNLPDKALVQLRLLGNKYKNTVYAEKIVQAARPLFVAKSDTAGYKAFAESLNVNIQNSELDQITLTSAKNVYTNKDYGKAIPLYEKYLTKNPAGADLYQVEYELADSYLQLKNSAKATVLMEEVAKVPNDYREDAAMKLSQIYLAQNNYESALRNLEILQNSSVQTYKNYALVEMMKLYTVQNNLAKAEKLADEVLKNANHPSGVLEQAKVVKARSAMMSGRDAEAKSAYSALEKSANTSVAAEAFYAKALYQNKVKAYKSSNETIFKIANNYASEEYWGAKSLLLMARNYIGLKDNYQASYTADQIISNYADMPEIVAEAREIKKLIK